MDHRPLHPIVRYIHQLAGVPAQPDHDLLSCYRDQRDETAFSTLVERHGPLVLGVCRRVLHNDHDAEDVFQATFLVLARKAGSIRQRESLGGWLYRVAYRLALRVKSRVVRQSALPAAEHAAEPADSISWREMCGVLDAELQRLPEKYRAPLVLCYLAGKTRDEAAEELGWTVGTVKGRLEKGRELLRQRLTQRGVGLPAALLGTLLMDSTASAAPAAGLVTGTVKAAMLSPELQATALPAQVLTLAQAGAGMSVWSKWLATAALLLGIGVSSLGLAYWSAPGAGEAGGSPVVFLAEQSSGPAFRDITKECGLAAIVDDKYAATPKWWLAGLHLVDLDGDGHLDFFMSAHGGGAVATLNDGKGHFKRAEGDYPSTEIHLAHDIDEDGTLDLAMTFQDGGGQWWLNRSKPGMLHFEPTKIERGTNTARRQALIDLNRDGKVDWLRGTPQAIVVEYGDGKGGFTDKSLTLPTGNSGRGESLCLPIDLDGDGNIDLISEWGHYTDPKGSSRIFRNDGNMKFTDVTREAGLPLKDFSIKGVGDLNRDGFPDLICLVDKQQIEIYLNDGKGRFTRSEGAIQGIKGGVAYASWGVAVVTDFDNDGVPDILINGKNFLKILRGTGDGKFTYMNDAWGIKDYAFSSVDDGLCFGDIDGDGDLDIVGYVPGGGDRRTFVVYRNDLPKQHWLNVRPVGLQGNRGAAGAKIRVTEPGTGKLLWYEQVAIYDSQMAHSYYSFNQTERHFGLGQRQTVDVSIEFYPSGKKVSRSDVKADATVVIREE